MISNTYDSARWMQCTTIDRDAIKHPAKLTGINTPKENTMDNAQATSNVAVTREQLQAQIDALKAQNAVLLQQERATFSMKIGEKGGLSVYGMGRFPVSLYKEQWTKLFSHVEEIKAFITANDSKLKSK